MQLGDSSDTKNSRNWLSIPITFVIALILILFSSLGLLDGFRKSLGCVVDPIYSTSSSVALKIRDFFTTLGDITQFRTEYNEMKLTIAEYEIQNLDYQKLKRENIDLREQLKLGNKENLYVESTVLGRIESDYMVINLGLSDGVKNGDISVLGEAFIGIVIDAGQYSSKVRLPISKSSSLEVYIISPEKSSQRILSKAVVSGSSDGIRMENINMNSEVQNGDVVVVNDEKVGENLILGTVVGLSEDPATTTRSGYVSPVVDYYDLVNIFVRIEDVN